MTDPIRVACVADSHFDSSPGGRFEECVEVHDWILQDMLARDVDLILHAGDVFERRSTPEERLAVFSWFQRAAAIAPVVVVRGNHDPLRELEALRSLDTVFEIMVCEGAEVLEVAGCIVGCLAWPSKASVLAMGGASSRAEGELDASDALRGVLCGLGDDMCRAVFRTGAAPRILLAHAMVRGSVASTGQPLVGCDLEVGLDDLALARADVTLLGHIHKGQEWSGVIYPGSPRRTKFGELEPKGYLVVDFEQGAEPVITRVPTPCRDMVHLDATFDDNGLHVSGTLSIAEADVRLRYTVPADRRDEARALAQGMRDDFLEEDRAYSVKVEEVVEAKSAARAPEVAKAGTLEDKLRAMWRAQDRVPAADREREMLCKLCTLTEGNT